jgi:hypothetical protein
MTSTVTPRVNERAQFIHHARRLLKTAADEVRRGYAGDAEMPVFQFFDHTGGVMKRASLPLQLRIVDRSRCRCDHNRNQVLIPLPTVASANDGLWDV